MTRGPATVSNDTLMLEGFGMPNSSCPYFQDTTLTSALFGDGKRCAAGSVIRLGTRTDPCGASHYPNGIDASISVKGLAPAGGTPHHQAWCRNSAAFCTGSVFNLTNVVTFGWGS